MAYLTIKNKRLYIAGDHETVPEYTKTDNLSQVEGHLKKKRNLYPLDPLLANRLRKVNPDMEVSEAVLTLVKERRQKLVDSSEIMLREPRVFHPNARRDQNVGAEWLIRNNRAILGDEQGNGKTVTSLITLNSLPDNVRVLIVAPIKKLKDWKQHVEEWTKHQAFILNGTPLHRNLVLDAFTQGALVVGYDTAALHGRDLRHFDVVIVDEAHKLRNRKTGVYQRLREICHTAKSLYLLTASPIINGSGDLWTLFNLIDPQRFPSYWVFIYRYFHVYDELFGVKVGDVRESARKAFNNLVEEFILTRVNDSRPYEVHKSLVKHTMIGDQLELYESMRDKMECSFGMKVVEATGNLSTITRLRQLCLHPALIFPEYPLDGPSKFDALLALMEERRTPTVVFTDFAKLAELGKQYFTSKGYSVLTLTGGSKGDPAEEFQSGVGDMIFVTHGSGGEGLNLHRADRVVFLDIDWHPDGNTQAYKRIDRPMKQKAEYIEVIFIKTINSIEDQVYAINRRKQPVTLAALAREVFS